MDDRNQEIIVSVWCKTYNHAKYIRHALDGFVKQIFSHPYEIIVHDDCSQDGTQDIIGEYQAKYPDLFKVIYQEENKYSQGIKVNLPYMMPLVKGKYLAFCEGDDYWTDEYKLQKQFDAMESHKDCSICIHKVRLVEESGQRTEHSYPDFEMTSRELRIEDYLQLEYGEYKYLAQTSSFFLLSSRYRDFLENKPAYGRLEMGIGDLPLKLYLITLGNMYYLQDEMSCYRTESIGSFTSRYLKNKANYLKTREQLLIMADKFNEHTKQKYKEYMKQYVVHVNLQIAYATGNFRPLLYDKAFQEWRKQTSNLSLLRIWFRIYMPFLDKCFDVLYKITKKYT